MTKPVAKLELDTSGTFYGTSTGIDYLFKQLHIKLKEDMLANRLDLTNYVVTIERKPYE